MAFTSTQYVSLAAGVGAFQLEGTKDNEPFLAGSVLVAHGRFDDSSETGAGAFAVVRGPDKGNYVLAPLGCTDEYWGAHLKSCPQVCARLMKNWKEKPEKDMETLTRWRVVCLPGNELDPDELSFLGKAASSQAMKTWEFVRDNVVAEVRPQKDGKDLPPEVKLR